jgi:regulator of RNase E activity RraA
LLSKKLTFEEERLVKHIVCPSQKTEDVFRDRAHPQRKAVEDCPPGAVLVMDSRKNARAASAGAILVTRLMQRGVAGCGDAPVFPGDVILGDSDGVIVIPAHLTEEIAVEAFEMTAFEDFVTEQVRKGRSILGLYRQISRR